MPRRCGHCKQFASAYTQIAAITRGIVPLGAVDAPTDGPQKRIAADYGVSGFPTMKIFGDDKKNPKDVQTRDPSALVQELFKTLQETIQARGNGGAQGGGGGGRRADSKVVQLDAANFSEKVYDNEDVVLVAFAAPW